MDMYNNIKNLCDKRGISVYEMCKDTGIGRSVLSELKSGRSKTLGIAKARKIADFFGVSIDYLLGAPQDGADLGAILGIVSEEFGIDYNEALQISQRFNDEWMEIHNTYGLHECFRVYFSEKGISPKSSNKKTPPTENREELLRFALWNGDKGITQAQIDEVKRFAEFVKERDKKNGK